MPNYYPPLGKVTKLTGKEKEEVDSSLAQYRKEREFCEAHYKELLEEYPDQWIGILDEKVMGVAETSDALLAKFKAEGIPTNFMYVQRLATKPKILVVPVI